MTEVKEPFVASLWKVGAPEEFAAKELVGARDWDDAVKMAEEWAPFAISEGGLSVPIELCLKHGAKSKLLRRWERP